MPLGEDLFSTTEVNTWKVWIDGTTIYRKVVQLGALPQGGTTKNVAHGIIGLVLIVNWYGFATGVFPGGNPATAIESLPLPYVVPADAGRGIQVLIFGPSVRITTGVSWSAPEAAAYSCFVVLEYVKGDTL